MAWRAGAVAGIACAALGAACGGALAQAGALSAPTRLQGPVPPAPPAPPIPPSPPQAASGSVSLGPPPGLRGAQTRSAQRGYMAPYPAPAPLPPGRVPPQAAPAPAYPAPYPPPAYLYEPGRSSRGGRGLIGIRPPVLREDRQEGNWTIMVGGGVLVRPDFIGADTYSVSPIPAAAVEYKDLFFADPSSGIGLKGEPVKGVTVRAGFDYGFGRDEDDAARLRGMGDLDGGATAFTELELRPLPGILQALSLEVGLEAPFTGDVDGYEATTDLAVSAPIGAGGYASLSGGLVWSSNAMMDDLFGVTPAQSARGVLPAYDPDSGVRASSVGFTAFRPVAGRWNALLSLGYDRLQGDAADSPVVATRDQYRAGAGLVYRFGK